MHIKSIQLEAGPAAYCYPPNMRTGVFPARDDRLHQIATPKTKPLLLAPPVTNREAAGVRPTHLPCPVPFRRDQQHAPARHAQVVRRTGADTHCVTGSPVAIRR